MKSAQIAAFVLTAAALPFLASCSKKPNDMTFAHERFAVTLPKGVELSCKKLYNAGACDAYATGPMTTMDPDLVDAQICEGGTASTAFYVVATKRPTQAFLPYPGRNPSPPSSEEMMLAWGKCKDARIDDTRSVPGEGSLAKDFSLITPMGASKARAIVSDDYSIMAMAQPKSSGTKKEEIDAFVSSLRSGAGEK